MVALQTGAVIPVAEPPGTQGVTNVGDQQC
jgi:hypothetical protein